MWEWGLGVQITVTGFDGTTITFPDDARGLRLTRITGFDAPGIRGTLEDIPADDGARVGNSFYGARPVTYEGVFAKPWLIGSTLPTLKQAFRGLRGDVTLKSTPPPGFVTALQATARTTDGPRLSRGALPMFLVALVCPDPRMYAQTATTVAITTPSGAPSGAVTNLGDYLAPHTTRVTGPIGTNWKLQNSTSGEYIQISASLAASQWVDINFTARTVVRENGANWYDRLVYPGSEWWYLQPALNTVALVGSGGSAATRLDVTYRSSWV